MKTSKTEMNLRSDADAIVCCNMKGVMRILFALMNGEIW